MYLHRILSQYCLLGMLDSFLLGRRKRRLTSLRFRLSRHQFDDLPDVHRVHVAVGIPFGDLRGQEGVLCQLRCGQFLAQKDETALIDEWD